MKKRLGAFIAAIGLSTLAPAGEVSLSFSFDPQDVTCQVRGAYEKVHLAGAVLPEDPPGTPWLPAQYINVLIPSGATVTGIRAEGDEIRLRDDIAILPAQPPQKRSGARNAFVPARSSAYAVAGKVPATLAAAAGEHTMSGYSLVSVRLNPVRYVPASQELFLATQLRLTVAYAEPKARLAAPAAQRAEAAAWVRDLVVNGIAAEAFAPTAARGLKADTAAQYLVITRRACTNAFNALVQHRSARFTSQMLTVETITNTYSGTDAPAKIRACIADYYQNHGTLYVVLGGDDTLVPVRGTKVSVDTEVESAMPTDLYYSGLDRDWNANGNTVYGEVADNPDMAWEVIVGRIPVRTAAQATDYINKLISFETTPPTNISKKIILGGMVAWDTYTGTSRPSDDVTADGHRAFRDTAHPSVSDSEMWDRRLYRDGIRPYWQATTIGIFCDTLTSWDATTAGDYLENATNVRKRFNEGWWHLFFSGHGDVTAWGLESGAFYSSDATALTNKTPFVYTDACLTGHFDGSTDPCLSEAFLRNPTGGALVYLGCSRYGWGEPDDTPASNTSDGGPSTVYGYKYYKRLYESNNVTCGKAFAMHKADMISSSGANGSERWIQFGLNLQGDPAILPTPATQPTQSPPFLPAIGNQSTAVGQALQFTVVAQKTDGDAITNLWATGLPSGATFTPGASFTNGTFSWPNPAATGSYSVGFSAADNDGASSISVSVRVTNSTPVVGPAPLRAQGFESSAEDTWTYVATAGSGAIAATTERAMSGTKSLKMTGSNKLNADPKVEFQNVNLTGYSGIQLAIAFASSGPDGDDDLWLDLSFDNGATWTGAGSVKLVDGYGNANVAFGATSAANPATVAANPWTVAIPDGTAQLKVRVRYDEKIASANLSDHYFIDDVRLTGTAGGGTPQTPPLLAPIGNKSVQTSNTLSFTVTAAATDGDAITNLWATGLPAGATFTPVANKTSGTFSWTGATPAGSYSVTFWAGDNDGVDSETIAIAVTNPPAGGGAITLKSQDFEGAAGDTWTYAATAGLGTIVVSGDRSMAGTKSLKLSGSSSGAADPFVMFDNVSLAGCSGVVLSLAFSADGPDSSDDLYLDLSFDNGATWTAPGSLKLVDGYSGSKILFGATNASNPTTVGANPWTVAIPAGTAQLKVRVRYDENAAAANSADHYYIDSVKLTATTSGGPLGSPPILAAIGSKSVQISNALSFAVSANATDGDAITNLWATGLPAGATFTPVANKTSGTFSWASAAPAGSCSVSFWAGDKDGTVHETIALTVIPASSGSGSLNFQGFESSSNDTWTYATAPGAGTVAVSTGSMSGAKSLKLSGSATGAADPSATFANVSLAGLSGVQLAVAFSANGPDTDDDLWLDLSYDNGATWTGTGSVKLVDGYGNAKIAFGATVSNNPITVAANPWVVNIPASATQIRARVRFDEKNGAANSSDHYFIDDLRLTSGGGARVLVLEPQPEPAADDDPQVTFTDPAAEVFTVPNSATEIALSGTCNEFAAGWLAWSNDLNGAASAVLAAAGWTIPSVPLAVGENAIVVAAANAAGATATDIVTVTRRADDESSGGAALAFQGFEESADDTWAYGPGAGAAAASDARARTWLHSLQLTGSAAANADPAVEFANIDLARYDNAQVIVAFSAQGPDSGDDLWLDLSYDNGATWNEADSVKLVGGFRNLNLAFDATSSMSVGANPYTLEIPPGAEQVKVRVRFDEGADIDNTGDAFFIDDLRIVAEEIAGDDDDGDGLEDSWEESYFGSIVGVETNGNPDDDALSNEEEFILDRHPNDNANQDPRFEIEDLDASGRNLRFPASVRRCYTLQYLEDLSANPQVWTDVGSASRKRGTNETMSLPLEDEPGSRIYRIKVTLP